MKIVYCIILLLSVTAVQAQVREKEHTIFPDLMQEHEELYALNVDSEENLFTITNSSDGELVIELNVETVNPKGKYDIYNIFGCHVLQGQITEKITRLSTIRFTKGIYLLRVTTHKKQQTKKFLIR